MLASAIGSYQRHGRLNRRRAAAKELIVLRMILYRMVLCGSVLTAIGGCSSTPVLLNASEEGVVVRYSPGSVTAAEAFAAAQASCQRYGRNAVAQGTALTGDVFANFSCVK
jgi:hypothetical protein